MIRHWMSLSAALFVTFGTLGCGDALGPVQIEGTYLLTRLNSSVLPYDHDGLGCCTYLAGQLELSGGRYVMAITARSIMPSEMWLSTQERTSTAAMTGHSCIITENGMRVPAAPKARRGSAVE